MTKPSRMSGVGRAPARLAFAVLGLLVAASGADNPLPTISAPASRQADVALDATLAGAAVVPDESPSPTPTSTSTSTSTTVTPTSGRVAPPVGPAAPPAGPPAAPPAPPAPSTPGLTLTDTGLTRMRVTIDTDAAWVTLIFEGAQIVVGKLIETAGNARVAGLGGTQVAVSGHGAVVVDVVLSVPPGAATSLAMCKNYMGPATATLQRLTDGTTTVATFTNTGTDPVVNDGCENPARMTVDRAALIGPVRWPARRDPRPLVLANYYPWFDDAALSRSFGDQPIGPANTRDPATVAAAVGLAADNGIDGFIVEYEATPANNSMIDEAYRAADQRDGFTSCLMVDFDILLDHKGSLNGQVLDEALGAVAARASHPSQLRVDGQPVVFLYGARRVEPSAWTAALERLRAATGLRPFVVTDDQQLASPGQHLYSTNNIATADGLDQWASSARLDLRARPGLEGWVGPLWVAPVSPGYDDTRLGRSPSTFVDRRGGQRYDETWVAALRTLPDWIVVTSWNEYYEQTHIVPGSSTSDRALRQTDVWAAGFHTTG